MGESWEICNDVSLKAFIKNVTDLYSQHGFITYGKPRIGRDRSLTQNGLFHVWVTEVVAYRKEINIKSVTPGQINGTKRDIKKLFYHEYPEPWMIEEVEGTISGASKRDFTSSSKWKKGEMFQVLTWMQLYMANYGLVLESKGEFSKLTRSQND